MSGEVKKEVSNPVDVFYRLLGEAMTDMMSEDNDAVGLTELHKHSIHSGTSRSMNICRLCGRQLTGYSDGNHKLTGDEFCCCNDCVDLLPR